MECARVTPPGNFIKQLCIYNTKHMILCLVNGNLRQKRHAKSDEYNMEVLLAADSGVVNFHGANNVENYLLTIINIVRIASYLNKIYFH